MNSNINIPGLKGCLVTKIEERGENVLLHVEMERKPHTCPQCKKKTDKVHDYRLQRIKHLGWFQRKTEIWYKKRRYSCECGKRFLERNSFVSRYKRGSIEWISALSIHAIKSRSFKETSEIFGASHTTVIRRFDELSKREIKQVTELPKVIAIDEYKGDTKAGKYQLIIADGETRKPIDILPNRRKKTIKDYLKKHGTKVEIVIMDMSPSFKAAVQEALGKPVIVADRFHFVRYIYWALDGVRKRVQSSWHEYDRKKCKRMRHVFYKKSNRLTDEDHWYLQRYLGFSKELKAAYQLKKSFNKWFISGKENGSKNILQTKEALQSFYTEVTNANIPEFNRVVKTLQNWQIEIINSFAYNYSNGFLEGINNLTKVIKRNAFGFRSFERFRSKILLSHQYKNIGNHVG